MVMEWRERVRERGRREMEEGRGGDVGLNVNGSR